MNYAGVTAVSWGPWRAEFLGETDGGHRVGIWPHDVPRKDREAMRLTELVVVDPTEAGLRAALFEYARTQGAVTPLHDADDRWTAQLVKTEFPAVMTPRRKKRASKHK